MSEADAHGGRFELPMLGRQQSEERATFPTFAVARGYVRPRESWPFLDSHCIMQIAKAPETCVRDLHQRHSNIMVGRL